MKHKVISEPSRADWYRYRGYAHFDFPLSRSQAVRLVSDANNVRQHSFYPFISYVKEFKKYDSSKRSTIPDGRRIAYAAHKDAAIFSYYSHMLTPLFEKRLQDTKLQNVVLAYRKMDPPQSNIDFAERAFSIIRNQDSCAAIGMDIKQFFKSLPHATIRSAWSHLLNRPSLPSDHYAVFKAVTQWKYIELDALLDALMIDQRILREQRRLCTAKEFRSLVQSKDLIQNGYLSTPNRCGIPQGSPISGFLSNLAMFEIDLAISAEAKLVGATYLRYSDDILLIGKRPDIMNIKKKLVQRINLLGMAVNPEKDALSIFTRNPSGELFADIPLQYLGFTFDGQRTLIRSQTLARSMRRMKRAVRSAKYAAGRSETIFKQKIYRHHSHLGERRQKSKSSRRRSNFWNYTKRADSTLRNSKIRRQMRRRWTLLQKEIKR